MSFLFCPVRFRGLYLTIFTVLLICCHLLLARLPPTTGRSSGKELALMGTKLGLSLLVGIGAKIWEVAFFISRFDHLSIITSVLIHIFGVLDSLNGYRFYWVGAWILFRQANVLFPDVFFLCVNSEN